MLEPRSMCWKVTLPLVLILQAVFIYYLHENNNSAMVKKKSYVDNYNYGYDYNKSNSKHFSYVENNTHESSTSKFKSISYVDDHANKSNSSKLNDTYYEGDNALNLKKKITKKSIIQPPVDFAILGFAKCGTTSLLQQFQNNHPETAMLPGEITTTNHTRISERFHKLIHERKNNSLVLGIKNPSIAHSQLQMLSMKNHPPVKIIIGVRNPLFHFQSFYNYRSWEMFKHVPRKRQSSLVLKPTPNQIVKCGTVYRRDVSPHAPRFEFILMKLDKVDISEKDSNDLEYFLKCTRKTYSGNMANYIVPNDSNIFLYDIEQLQDKNNSRSHLFRKDLQEFLGLRNRIEQFPLYNTHTSHSIETNLQINICEDKHGKAYNLLMKNANLTARWIIDKFIQSPDVYVGNRDHFKELVESWVKNPCNI